MNQRLHAAIAVIAIGIYPVTANSATCGVDPQPLVFGSFHTLDGQPHETTADVSVTCDSAGPETVNYAISLSSGSGSYANRTLVSGANTVDYNIYADSSRSIIWGDGSSSSDTVSGNISFAAPGQEIRTHTAYGRVLGNQQTAMIGSYVDTIIVTLSY